MNTVAMLGALLGGIGLFILAISMMTDGLKLAAGSALRQLLGQWSKTPLRGVITGLIMTAVVQSSSAVTVASLGFVNAGLIKMRQALGIIYGANVGTTMTGWLVAVIGFKLNIQAFALPMIGLGMMAKLIRPNSQIGAFGWALVGFGLFFVGIDVLKSAFETLTSTFELSQFTASGIRGIFIFLALGLVMTILTQSSSASIALIITAASTGVIGLYAAGAMIIGANVGTTSTAALAAIGATPNAKRVAAAQVIFNLMTGVVALITLPLLFRFIQWFCDHTGIAHNMAVSLALFHTVFNVLGVALIFPLNNRLADFLKGRFRSQAEIASKPIYIDKTIAKTPALAVNALVLEATAYTARVSQLFQTAILLTKPTPPNLGVAVEALKKLSHTIAEYVVTIENNALPQEVRDQLTLLLRIEQYLLTCTLLAEKVSDPIDNGLQSLPLSVKEPLMVYFSQCKELTSHLSPLTIAERPYQQIVATCQREHDAAKEALLIAGTQKWISISQMSSWLDKLSDISRFTQHWHKAILRLNTINQQLSSDSQA